MKNWITLIFLLATVAALAQQSTIQERLGYPRDTKLLIIHADDLGVSHSENMASIEGLEKGVVTSGSIMVPCPWFPEIADYAKAHPAADLGLHLTLTSEWKFYKWGPVSSHNQVPTLLDKNGYLNETTQAFIANAKSAEVEKELRSQIERAKQFGIDPTHFDAHMAAAISTADFLPVILKLGREYKVPVHIGKEFSALFGFDVASYLTDKDVVVDKTIMAMGDSFEGGLENFYTAQLKSLQSGLTVFCYTQLMIMMR